jgi:hypothetical protein
VIIRISVSSRATSHADHLVAGTQLHATHTAGVAAHRAHLVLVEPDGHADLRDHEDVVGAAGLDHPHQFVVAAQVDRDQAVTTPRVVLVERGLLHRAAARGEEQVALAGEVARVDDRLDRLAGLQRQQVDDRHALRRALALGDVHRPQAVHLAAVAEEQQERVRRGEDDVAHDVVGLHLRRRSRHDRRGPGS